MTTLYYDDIQGYSNEDSILIKRNDFLFPRGPASRWEFDKG